MNSLFYFIKVLNIFYIGIFYFIIGSIVASFVTKIYPSRDEKELKKITTFRLYCETVLTASTLFIMIYFCRKIVKYIGSPFHNIAGFDFYRLRELNGGLVLSLALILFSPKLIKMTREISERITKKKDPNKKVVNTLKTDLKLVIIVIIICILLIATYIIRYRSGALKKIKSSINNSKANTVAVNSANGNNSNGGL
jgi:hypothetical protein